MGKGENPTSSDHQPSNVSDRQVKKVVAVMSGKGGVGKSFVTGLLACGLAREGYQVGVLDADITGPSIPMLFGLHGPVDQGPLGILPLKSRSGIHVISMNLLLEREDQPVIWRGPLISKVITQMWEEVMWGDLDYLLVDLPPGTSDAALTIMQSLPVCGVLMVTTPQNLASMIVKKAVHMAHQIGVPVLGVIENMAYYLCPDTGKQHFIFGPSHGEAVAKTAEAPLLAQIPLDPVVAERCDGGNIDEVIVEECRPMIETFVNILPLENRKKETTRQQQPEKEAQRTSNEQQGNHYGGLKQFSDTARRLILTKENIGCIENADARGYFRGECGDEMQIDLRLAGSMIVEARFMTNGCGATVACGSMVTKMARTKSLAQAMEVTPHDLVSALDGLPQNHLHCADLAVNTLREAVIDATDGRSIFTTK